MNPNRTRIALLFIIIMMMVSVSCEKERTSAELIKSLKGEWKVTGEDQYSETTYWVTIYVLDQDSSRISISNFYQCDDKVKANVAGQQINLDEDQDINAGITSYKIISGSGTITDDYQNIDWRYKVDDGSGEAYIVTAVYTKK